MNSIEEKQTKSALWLNRHDTNRRALRSSKVGRNDPCPCGSGIKYKKCCGKVKMVAQTDPKQKKMKVLNQVGINKVVYILTQLCGGEVQIPAESIKQLENGELKVGYDPDTDTFTFIATEKQTIITPDKRIIT